MEFTTRSGHGRAAPSTASTWRCSAARSSRWSASPARARRRWRGRCSGCSPPTSGEVLVEGEPLAHVAARRCGALRRQVQMVLQDAAGSLNPRQTVYESVAEGIRLHGLVARTPRGRTEARPGGGRALRGRAAAAGAAVPALPPRAVRRPEAAGADRGRAGAATASCSSPTSRSRRSTPRSAARSSRCCSLRDELGLGVVVVTHDLGLAWNIADRIAVMYLGRVVECGTTEEVLEAPQHPYTRALLSVVPEIERIEPVVLQRRDPGPDPDPGWLPVPPTLPGTGRRHGGRGRASRTTAGHRAARRCCRRPGDHRAACHLVT